MIDQIPTEPQGKASLPDRLRRASKEPESWRQLARFVAVGASGYVVNLAVFALMVEGLDADHRLGAVVAFLVAVTNNFVWNRVWTFSAHGGHAGSQAWKFLTVSCGAFAVNLALLELLISAGLAELPSQAIAVAAATPFNFLGNKLWTFQR
ncbi:MAG TPA: GtrA family protein [Baekduia sp.]|nr:GtrA family protein [Baekduia sp.]